jgi:hypothetical protein
LLTLYIYSFASLCDACLPKPLLPWLKPIHPNYLALRSHLNIAYLLACIYFHHYYIYALLCDVMVGW